MHKQYLSILTLLLIIKAFLLVFVILYGDIGLGPDEAQYWTWSQSLDWGYYSKPPGIAWEIALGTLFFGNTEFGVRFVPLVIGFFLPFIVYLMAMRCRLAPKICFWAAVCMALSPIGILASFLAITDRGMVLFWTLACAYIAGKIEKEEAPNYLLMGILVFLGALFKWPIYGFWLVVLMSWFFFPSMRSWRIFGGIFVSLLALLPSVYWNATHDWATFRHVLATLAGGHAQPKEGVVLSGNFLEFLGAQAVLVSPILFVLLICAWRRLLFEKTPLPKGVFFCGAVSLVCVATGALMSIFMKIQGNWAIFAYPSAFVLLSWYVWDGALWTEKWMKAGIVLSVVVCAFVFAIPTIQSRRVFENIPIPYKINPFRHNIGWNELETALTKSGYDEKNDFLFSDKYQTTSILSFYGSKQKIAYFLNIQGSRKNQFSFWPGMEKEIGKRGFFVVVENVPQLNRPELIDKYIEELSPYFAQVKFIGIEPMFHAYGARVKGALIFQADGYNGVVPKESLLY